MYEYSEEQLHQIGESILADINISLFNAEPTLQKTYYLYKELLQTEIGERDRDVLFNQIALFFKKRTVKNQAKEFHRLFKIPYNNHLRAAFSLSFKTAIISDEKIFDVSTNIYRNLLKIDIQQLGVDERILAKAIYQSYRPHYTEDEWKISLSQFHKKLKHILMQENKGHHLKKLEELFSLLDPSASKKVRKGSSFRSEGIFSTETSSENSLLADPTVIRVSEIIFIKDILKTLEGVEVPEKLSTNLYESDHRHPMVRNFLGLVKNYNYVMSSQDGLLNELLAELKMVVKSLKETGRQIIDLHSERISRKQDQLNYEIKKSA